jgi:surface protein
MKYSFYNCFSLNSIDLNNFITENAIDLPDTSIKYIGESIVKGTPLYSKLYKFDISNTKCEGEPQYTLKDICN